MITRHVLLQLRDLGPVNSELHLMPSYRMPVTLQGDLPPAPVPGDGRIEPPPAPSIIGSAALTSALFSWTAFSPGHASRRPVPKSPAFLPTFPSVLRKRTLATTRHPFNHPTHQTPLRTNREPCQHAKGSRMKSPRRNYRLCPRMEATRKRKKSESNAQCHCELRRPGAPPCSSDWANLLLSNWRNAIGCTNAPS